MNNNKNTLKMRVPGAKQAIENIIRIDINNKHDEYEGLL